MIFEWSADSSLQTAQSFILPFGSLFTSADITNKILFKLARVASNERFTNKTLGTDQRFYYRFIRKSVIDLLTWTRSKTHAAVRTQPLNLTGTAKLALFMSIQTTLLSGLLYTKHGNIQTNK